MASPLFKLPREIRDEIYNHALIQVHTPMPRRRYLGNEASRAHDKPIVMTCLVYDGTAAREGKEDGPQEYWTTYLQYDTDVLVPGRALLLVSKQIHQEAAESLYRGVRFSISCGSTASHFFKSIGRANAGLIRHLELSSFDDSSISALQACTGLQTVRIDSLYPNFWLEDPYDVDEPLAGIKEVHCKLVEGKDARATLVVNGTRDEVTTPGFLTVIRGAIDHGWSIRRVEEGRGLYNDENGEGDEHYSHDGDRSTGEHASADRDDSEDEDSSKGEEDHDDEDGHYELIEDPFEAESLA